MLGKIFPQNIGDDTGHEVCALHHDGEGTIGELFYHLAKVRDCKMLIRDLEANIEYNIANIWIVLDFFEGRIDGINKI